MKKIFYKNYIIFSAVLAACLALFSYLLITGIQKIEENDNWVEKTRKVIIESEQLNTLVAQLVSSQRGYIISNDDQFLNEYLQRKNAFSHQIDNLRNQTKDNPQQLRKLDEIYGYFISLSELLQKRAEEGLSGTMNNMLSDVDRVRSLKNSIFMVNRDLLETEYVSLNQHIEELEQQKDRYFYTMIIGGTISVILLVLFNRYLLKAQLNRRDIENTLSEKEAVFKLAIEGSQDGVFDWNLQTGEAFYSDQYISMLGLKPFDFNHTMDDFNERLHPDEKENVLEYIQYYIDDQLSEYSNIFRMKHKSGMWLWIHSRGKIIRGKNQEALRMVGSHTDITALKEYEKGLEESRIKAEEANQAKSDFLAHMSHEIRTPLTAISGVAEILAHEEQAFGEKEKKLIGVLQDSSTALKDLVADILDFSKIESGEIELEEKSFNLEKTFQHIISIMSVRAKDKQLDFSFSYEDLENITLYGDPIRIRQIMLNLVGNAIKFTDHGHVKVSVRKKTEEGNTLLLCEVEDTGIGIKKEQHEQVFEHFRQADSSISRRFGGTGLGLPISKKLAQIMDGDILISSEIGKGSLFTLLLPYIEIADMPIKANNDKIKKRKLDAKLKSVLTAKDKVLLVEDYQGNVVFLSYILEGLACDYDVAKTGIEALNLWKKNHYDVILMDIQMPEMDGFTATKAIRSIEAEQGLDATPIIGMTAHALVGDRDKCLTAGMNSYLPKPIVEMDLKSAILDILSAKNEH